MAYPNFRKNHNKKNLKSKNKMLIGRKRFTEPLIISGKYFGIKLLSVYEFMNCLKMKKTLENEMVNQGFDKHICEKICEYACLISMCLYDSQNNRVFENGLDVLKNITPEELKFIYEEYVKLLNKIMEKDNITRTIIEKAKRYYCEKENIL